MDDFPNPALPILEKPGIYAFRHKTDGKVYVGQSKDVRKRRSQHEGKTSSNSRRFHNALKAHGVEFFEFFVLEYCDMEMIDERETHWISKLDSLHPNGYNLKSGGGALHEHHPETKAIMSLNQKARVASGEHLFSTNDFQKEQAQRQRELARQGLHSSQDPEFQAKRNKTVQSIIDRQGKFFSHKQETIDKKRLEQNSLYDAGLGKFQQSELIAANKKRVQAQLEAGEHFSQREGWSERARTAAKDQMKQVCLAIRRVDGATTIDLFESLHDAQLKIAVDRSHLSAFCKAKSASKALICDRGLIVRACFGSSPSWDMDSLEKIPTSQFLSSVPVIVTIETENGSRIQRKFISQHAACDALEAHHRAFRWIIKGEKYKSTKCNLGRIVKVEEIEPDSDLINALIHSRGPRSS